MLELEQWAARDEKMEKVDCLREQYNIDIEEEEMLAKQEDDGTICSETRNRP
jgi:hypothetical protein